MKILKVIGYGNMSKAILHSLLKKVDAFNDKSELKIDSIEIYGRDPEKIDLFLNNFFQSHTNSLFLKEKITLIKKTKNIDIENSILLLACKPYNLGDFTFIGNAHLCISVLAGISPSKIKEFVNYSHIALVMPNIGAFVGMSSSAVMLDSTNNEIKKEVEIFISSFGNCVFVDSFNHINASIATNGSSPAILALVAQALINAGVHEGLSLDNAKKLTQKSFEGIAQLLKTKSPQEIKDMITSPGGTTSRAILHCDKTSVQGNIAQSLINAVNMANGKS